MGSMYSGHLHEASALLAPNKSAPDILLKIGELPSCIPPLLSCQLL